MNNATTTVVVAGLGEIGRPLLDIISTRYHVVGIDINPLDLPERADILHVCYPYQIHDFIGETARYIDLLGPMLTIINSTVAVGTTRAVAQRTGAAVVNSPVRGKHARMREELLLYTKFVGALDESSGAHAAKHFHSLGMKTTILSSPEATELAKVTETTYFGILIAWAQEVERYCDNWHQNYEEVVSFYEEIQYLPRVKYFPGVIGGHCVMPNLELLIQHCPSAVLEAIRRSNEMKLEREISGPRSLSAAFQGIA